MMDHRTLTVVRQLLAGLVAFGLAAGFAARLAGFGAWSAPIWVAVKLPVLAALAVVALTYAGGQFLESFAERAAR